MRRWFAALGLFILVLGAWVWFSQPRAARTPPEKPAAQQNAAVAEALATASPQAAAIIASNFAPVSSQTIFYSMPRKPSVAPAGKPRPLEFTNLSPAVALDNVRLAIHNYGSMLGGNPVGLNSEITSQLNGENPKQVHFIRPEAGMRINPEGELVDPWGTPYFFHQLSGSETEIRSAGPDKIMWTADDLVAQ
jgi:hypothetical protein